MNVLKRVCLFSINNPSKEGQVERYMEKHNILFKKVKGCYRGQLEDSYVAIMDEDDKLDYIFNIAAKFNQESILIVDEYRKAYLYDVLTGDVKDLGDFKTVTALEAKDLEGWTLDGTQYYAVV